MAIVPHPSVFVHPGEWLKTEIIEAHNAQISELAKDFGVSRQALSALLNARAGLTADMALRFEKRFGISADTTMRMQAAYDLAQARLVAMAADAGKLAA